MLQLEWVEIQLLGYGNPWDKIIQNGLAILEQKKITQANTQRERLSRLSPKQRDARRAAARDQSLRRRIENGWKPPVIRVNECGHPSLPHHARGKCKSCYHQVLTPITDEQRAAKNLRDRERRAKKKLECTPS